VGDAGRGEDAPQKVGRLVGVPETPCAFGHGLQFCGVVGLLRYGQATGYALAGVWCWAFSLTVTFVWAEKLIIN